MLVVLFLVGLIPRLHLDRSLQNDADAERARLPMVSTANPTRSPATIELPLPGSMEPILETGIWARTNGYLKARYVDIGDRVAQGKLLAIIETPEIDQQLEQAIATRNQDLANVAKFEADLALARTTLQRYIAAGPGTVSKQQIDERNSAVTDAEKAVEAGEATVAADEANVRRLGELQSFQNVYAPFDGVITIRNVDPGSLISAGSTSGTTELFRLAQVDVLRIFVFVPQSYAPDIQVGQKAEVTVREQPGRVFEGNVTRTAGAIDSTSRTLLTEVQVPNPDGALLSGSYATVEFQISRAQPPLTIPSSALLIDCERRPGGARPRRRHLALPAGPDRPRLRQRRGGGGRPRRDGCRRDRPAAEHRRRKQGRACEAGGRRRAGPGGEMSARRRNARTGRARRARVPLWLAGCMVGPDYARPDVDSPDGWGELTRGSEPGRSQATIEGIPTAWWVSFDDPVLSSIIERTVKSNLTLQQAEARVLEARASRRIAAAPLWPEVDAGGSYTRARTSKNGPGTRDAREVVRPLRGGLRRELGARRLRRQPPRRGGRRRRRSRRPMDDRNAVLVSLMGEVGLEYVTYRSLQQRIALTAGRTSTAQQQTLDLTRRLFDAGPGAGARRAARGRAGRDDGVDDPASSSSRRRRPCTASGVLTGELPMALAPELARRGADSAARRPQVAVGHALRAAAAPPRHRARGAAARLADRRDRRRDPRSLPALLPQRARASSRASAPTTSSSGRAAR